MASTLRSNGHDLAGEKKNEREIHVGENVKKANYAKHLNLQCLKNIDYISAFQFKTMGKRKNCKLI